MTNLRLQSPRCGLPLLILVTVSGCDPPRQDLRPLGNDLVQKQAAQQESLVRQSEQLSEESRKLVEADAQARRELAEFQSTVQTQIEGARQGLDQQRNDLEHERRDMAQQRHRDPLIAAALIQAATLVVAALPIVLVIVLLRAARQEPADAPMGEWLVRELSAERPVLLPPGREEAHRLDHDGSDSEDRASGKSNEGPSD